MKIIHASPGRGRNNEWSQRWAKTAAESHGAGLGIPNSLFGRNNSLFREQQ
jgi:hypothetical protein